jgi:hypothetical protein
VPRYAGEGVPVLPASLALHSPRWTLLHGGEAQHHLSISLTFPFHETSLFYKTLSTLVLSTNNPQHAAHTWHGPLA